MLGGLPGLAGFALARDHDVPHAHRVQGVVYGFLAVAAVGGDVRGLRLVRLMTRLTAGASCGASAGLPCSRVWSGTTPSSLSVTWPLQPNWTGLPRLPLAIGRASPSCRLTRRLPPSGVLPASCCRVCAAICPAASPFRAGQRPVRARELERLDRGNLCASTRAVGATDQHPILPK